VHRVKKELLQKDFCEGGLKMINLNLFILALKTFTILSKSTSKLIPNSMKDVLPQDNSVLT
jgi:hypothetical protein